MILLRLKLQPHTAELGGQTALLCVQPVQQTGHRLARFFGAVWLIDWLARPPSLRAVPDGQGHTVLLAANFLMRGTDHGSFSASVSHCSRLPAITQILLTCCCHRTTLYYTISFPSSPLHHIVSFRWMYSHWLQALSYRKLFFDISKFTYCSESNFFWCIERNVFQRIEFQILFSHLLGKLTLRPNNNNNNLMLMANGICFWTRKSVVVDFLFFL